MGELMKRIGKCDFTSANHAEIRKIMLDMAKEIAELKKELEVAQQDHRGVVA